MEEWDQVEEWDLPEDLVEWVEEWDPPEDLADPPELVDLGDTDDRKRDRKRDVIDSMTQWNWNLGTETTETETETETEQSWGLVT